MHWFPDCNADEVRSIIDTILESAKNPDVEFDSLEHLFSLSQLNTYLGDFSEKSVSDSQSLKRDILRISRLFEELKPVEIRSLLNEKRAIAGFPQIEGTGDVVSIIAEMRSEIRKTITKKLAGLTTDKYMDFVTAISESFSGKRSKGQAVLEDVIAEYELRINRQLEETAGAIINTASQIKARAEAKDFNNLDWNLKSLLTKLSEWDKLAQPMQLSALIKGDAHKESAEMFSRMRELSIVLHNQYRLSEQALSVNSAMQTVFAEMPEHLAILKKDEKDLREQIQGKKNIEYFEQNIKRIESLIEGTKTSFGSEIRRKIDEILKESASLDLYIWC